MTDAGMRSADTLWRTAVGQALVAGFSIVAGRWVAGPTFGFVLFLLIWLPMIALWRTGLAGRRARWAVQGASLSVTAIAVLSGWPVMVGFQLFAAATLFSVTVAIAGRVCSRVIGETVGHALVLLVWLAWLTVPLTLADVLSQRLGEFWMARILSLNPVLICNQLDATAGDWTHQAIAYATLTRLGQDVSFNWPPPLAPALAGYIGFALLMTTVRLVVPRGTYSDRRD